VALVARVRMQDTDAFGVLYDRYAPAVYALAAHMLGTADAQEVVQDVFLRLWQRAAQFDPTRSAFGTWFMAIARHRILDELRRRGQARRLAATGDVERLLARVPDPALDPNTQAWLRDVANAVHRALAELPDDQRRALVLGYFGGFSQSAVADLLGWPLGTVKKRVRLGLQKLRRALNAFSDDDQLPGNPTDQPPQPDAIRRAGDPNAEAGAGRAVSSGRRP
jgi:RNA polymerase sigma-70 factor, ECF subfamily